MKLKKKKKDAFKFEKLFSKFEKSRKKCLNARLTSQTDTTNIELKEMYEDMIIYLHGVDYIEMTADFSFDLLQTQVGQLAVLDSVEAFC